MSNSTVIFFRPEPGTQLDQDDEEFLKQFLCERCDAFGLNTCCDLCGAHVCDECIGGCCPTTLPLCSQCNVRRIGSWTCSSCALHVCSHCAPANRAPPAFELNGFCRACLRLMRINREMARLRNLPEDLRWNVYKKLRMS